MPGKPHVVSPSAPSESRPRRQPSHAAGKPVAAARPAPALIGSAAQAPAATARSPLAPAGSSATPLTTKDFPPSDRRPGKTGFDPTSRYVPRDVRGWRAMVHESLLKKEPELGQQTLGLLGQQLYQIEYRLPRKAVAQLRQVKIWIELDEPHHPCMVYHPGAAWLTEHGMNPEKARSIEIANSRNFLKWSLAQPFMTLHELSHAYHDQFLGGFDNPQIKAAYDEAVAAKIYEQVLFADGRSKRHYGLTNPQEFFAEASEAFFGVNDFYPFVRAELARHDRRTYNLLTELWWRD